jgi:hypothetical protein
MDKVSLSFNNQCKFNVDEDVHFFFFKTLHIN